MDRKYIEVDVLNGVENELIWSKSPFKSIQLFRETMMAVIYKTIGTFRILLLCMQFLQAN